MKNIIFVSLVLLLVLFFIVFFHALILGWAIFVGWLLSQIPRLDFSLFEGSLLGLITTGIITAIMYQMLSSNRSRRKYDEEVDFQDDFQTWLNREFEIPPTRFYKTETEKTWEAWIRYGMANSIYQSLEDAPYSIVQMGERQLQELAIRLGDIGIAVIKGKSTRSKSLSVSITALKQQMTKMKQRPYDDDILKLAVKAINNELKYEDTNEVIQDKLWDEPCDLFD